MKKNKKNKKKIIKKIKGFTLIELLAVIIVLAIILIIAIPSVLSSLSTTKEKVFNEYIDKAYSLASQEMLAHEAANACMAECVLFNLTTDFDLNSTGDFNGYVMAVSNGENYDYFITLWDEEYMVYGLKYTNENIKNLELKPFTSVNDPNLDPAYLAFASGCDGYSDNTVGKCVRKTGKDAFQEMIKKLETRSKEVSISCEQGKYGFFLTDINDIFVNTLGLEGVIFSQCDFTSGKLTNEATYILNDEYVYYKYTSKINNPPSCTIEYLDSIANYNSWTPNKCSAKGYPIDNLRTQKSFFKASGGSSPSWKDGITGEKLVDKYRNK